MTLYEKLPTNKLTGFYYEIKKNIDSGILSTAMYHEMNLIKKEAEKRGIFLLDPEQEDK